MIRFGARNRCTRWHHDDLAGRILNSHLGHEWRVVELPAIADVVDQLGREPGEALWPEWEDLAALERKREEVGDREWSALFQQRPTPLEGALFKVGMLETWDAPPGKLAAVVRSWDLAATAQSQGNPDWTRGIKFARTMDNTYLIMDVVSLRGGPDEVFKLIVNTAAADGRGVTVRIPQDPGQAGVQQVAHITRNLAGYTVVAESPSGRRGIHPASAAWDRGARHRKVLAATSMRLC